MNITELHSGDLPNTFCDSWVSSNGTVELRRATEDDFDWMIDLRNQVSVRRWFFDTRPIGASAGRSWLAARAKSNDDTVLIICHKATKRRVGTLGWICVKPVEGIYETGRLALDSAALRKLRKTGVPTHDLKQIPAQASHILGDYIFLKLNGSLICTEYKPDNILAAKLNAKLGFEQTGVGTDGRILCQLTRHRWQKLFKTPPCDEGSIFH